MPRIRCIKPSFWSDENLAKISRDARLVFIGLWNFSDDYGVVQGAPAFLKSQLFPYDSTLTIEEFSGWLTELEKLKVIVKMYHHENTYYFLPNFLKHQKIDRPSATRNPDPSEMTRAISKRTRRGLVEGSRLKGEGKGEGEGDMEVERDRDKDMESGKPDAIPFSEIIDDLNQKSGRSYSPKSKATQTLIRLLWEDGRRLVDFQKVHTNKVLGWLHDPKMRDYLRPETIYNRNKFEGYLNEDHSAQKYSPETIATMRAGEELRKELFGNEAG